MLSMDRGKCSVELGVASGHAERPSVRAREKEAIMPVFSAQAAARFVAGISARQGHDAHHARMVDQRLVEVGHLRQRQLQHDLLVSAEGVQLFQDFEASSNVFRCCLVCDGDRDFRLDDRNQAVAQDLRPISNCCATTAAMPS
jgi:hypothetical protein